MSESFDPQTARSLFVVGDDAQSIYGFRGSKVEIILNFAKEYPGAKEIILNQNYRSTQPILDLAEQILSHNPQQKKKSLFTENQRQVPVIHYHAYNDRDEAEYIVRKLYQLYGQNHHLESEQCLTTEKTLKPQEQEITLQVDAMFDTPIVLPKSNTSSSQVAKMFDVYLETEEFAGPTPTSSPSNWLSWQVPTYDWKNISQLSDCVVLYRTHSQSRSLEEVFLKYGLPYRLLAGVKFLERREIKDVLAMLRWLNNNEDKLSLSRFLPLVLDGVGAKTMEKILAYLEDPTYPLPPKYQQQWTNLFLRLQSLWSNHQKLVSFTKELVHTSGYLKYLKLEYPDKNDFEARLENINELYSLMLPFDEDTNLDVPAKLKAFLDKVSLMTTSEAETLADDNTAKINLMSLHQSKGLEFETVFIVGIEDGLLPHRSSFLEPQGLAEEVRLAYVGVTRAKANLFLVSCQSRVQFGQIQANPISRIFRPFLDRYCKREFR